MYTLIFQTQFSLQDLLESALTPPLEEKVDHKFDHFKFNKRKRKETSLYNKTKNRQEDCTRPMVTFEGNLRVDNIFERNSRLDTTKQAEGEKQA